MEWSRYFPYSRLLTACLVLAGLVSCSSEAGREERVAYAYADILRYRDAQPRADSNTVRLGIDSVLSQHGLTHDSYLQQFRAFADDPTTLRPFFQKVQDRLAQTNPLPPAPAPETADQ